MNSGDNGGVPHGQSGVSRKAGNLCLDINLLVRMHGSDGSIMAFGCGHGRKELLMFLLYSQTR